MEIYNLEAKNFTTYATSDMFGNICSESFIITKAPDEPDSNNYYYLMSYVEKSSSGKYLKNIRKIYFSFERSQGYGLSCAAETEEIEGYKLISGFYIENSIYISVYLSRGNKIIAKAYNTDFTQAQESVVYSPNSFDEKVFFKGIHLKQKIGFFIYFKSKNAQYPSFSILECNNDLKMETYLNYKEKDINDKTFNSDWLLNDIIKLNDFQICYISIDSDKKQFQLVVFTLYKNDNLMNMRYYDVEMYNSHR